MVKKNFLGVLLVAMALFAYACSEEEGGGSGKDAGLDVVVQDVVTDTYKPDAGKDATPDVEDVVDVSPDVEDVGPDVEDIGPDVADVGPDVEDVSPDVGPEVHKYTEEEPNNGLDSANKVELNAEISGQIDEPVYDAENDIYINDMDLFEFDAKAGDILRLEAKALDGMDLVPVVILVDKDTGGSFLYRAGLMNIDQNKNAGLTALIPRDGKYIAAVAELTNLGQNPANVGGEKYKYTLTISYSSLDSESLDLSVVPKKVNKTMAIDRPDMFEFNLAEEKLVKAETSTDPQVSPDEKIDTILTLFWKDKNTLIEVADNIDPYSNNFDSLLAAYTPKEGGKFYLLVESIVYTDQKTDYELDVDLPSMDTEIEPNDTYLTASPIRIPSETSGVIGTPKDGVDDQGNPIKVGDVDNFYFYGKPGELYRFTIIAENGSPASPLDSWIAVYQVVDTIFGPYPIAINLNDNSNGADSMAEALISEEGKYYVMVSDARNSSDNPAPVGGDDYKYKLKVEKISLNATSVSSYPYTDSGSLVPAGAYKFYKFSGVKGDKFTIEVYQDSGSNTDFVPFIVLYDADTYKALASSSGDENDSLKKATLKRISADTTNYLIAILDSSGNGGADYKYKIDIKREKLPYYDETEPNDDTDHANQVKDAHSLYFGSVDGDGENPEDLVDMYKFTASIGQVLNVEIFAGKDPEAYDTKISILDSEGNVLASNEDIGNYNYYSAIRGFGIPYDGDFYIMVEPQTDYGAVKGNYIMEFELINGCLASSLAKPQSGELVINEYYTDPQGDANGDGATDTGDQFIEIFNPTDKDLLLEISEVKVVGVSKFKFACGTVIPSNKAIVLFGGGKPDGYFGDSQVFVTRQGLGLPNGITIYASIGIYNGQTEITTVQYDANSSNVGESFTRDPDITGNFVKHSTATGANGAKYSPGTRVDGLPFIKGFLMKETEPNNDSANANQLPSNESEITVFGNLKYQEGAQDNDLDDFFKITLTAGKKISLTTMAGLPPEVTDTTLVLLDSNGNELTKSEDIDFSNYYSQILDFEIPADGDYYIDVKAETAYGSLPGTGYQLKVEIK